MTQPRILIYRIHQVVQAISLSRSTIYRLQERGLFPKPIKIGITAVGWTVASIDIWLAERTLAAQTIC